MEEDALMVRTSSNRVSNHVFAPAKALLALALCFAVSVALCCVPAQAYADVYKSDVILGKTVEERDLDIARCPNIFCERAALIDEEGNVLFERDAYSPAKIASITKVMTAIIALENTSLTDSTTVSYGAIEVGESSAGLEAGDLITMEELIKAMIVPSGNDAAHAIMEFVGARLIADGKTQQTDPAAAFIEAMNKKAAEIGCKDTLFTNPHGLDDGDFASDAHSTAYDVAVMSRYAMQNEFFASVTAAGNNTIDLIRNGEVVTIYLDSTNQLLDLYAPCTGLKTGSTDEAGYCFAGSATSGTVSLYSAVLGSDDPSERFFDTRDLMNWGFAHRVEYKLIQSMTTTRITVDGTTKTVPVVASVPHAAWTDRTFYATVANPDQSINLFDIEGNVSQQVDYDEVESDVHVGDKVGTITFFQRNVEIAKVDMISCEEVEAPSMLERLGIWFERLLRGFRDEPTVAEGVVYNQTPLLNNRAGA